MSDKPQLPTTQRAYTLRLRGIEGDNTWRDALWATHEAVNKGAKVFGDWLLTLRGGLDHKLAEDGSPAQRKDRRILLALSWLSVEDCHGAPDEFEIEPGIVADALRQILGSRGVGDAEAAQWMDDCGPSLRSRIRDDATWVNRSAAFDAALRDCLSLNREEIWDFLEPFFTSPKAYLMPEQSEADETDASVAKDEPAKDLVQKAGGWLSRRMGEGSGADFDILSKAYHHIATWAKTTASDGSGTASMVELARSLADFSPASEDADGVLSTISGPGYKSATRNHIKKLASLQAVSRADIDQLAELAAADAAECHAKIGDKGQRPYSNHLMASVERACGWTYLNPDGPARHREFSVMLDHAARRVNVAHSWIKNAEAERRQFAEDSRRIANVPAEALAWLEAYCADRKASSGSLEAYRIRRRAIDGWDKIVERWSGADCATSEDRVRAARELQDDPEIDKFGDIQLFEALADEDAQCVWKPGGTPSAQPLKDFVFAKEAAAKQQRFKVPAYRHPDPLRHPVFTDFGNSRWDINFSAHRAPTALGELTTKIEKRKHALADAERKYAASTGAKRDKLAATVAELRADLGDVERQRADMADRHRVKLRLWSGHAVEDVPLRWSCKRLTADLALRHNRATGEKGPVEVTRADRLGRAAAGVDGQGPVAIAGVFDEKDWNGRLQAPRAQLDAIARRVDKHGWDAKAQTMLHRIRWLVSFSAKLTPQGPWTEFAGRLNLKPDPQYWPHAEANRKRQSHARLALSRLPGLRLLSVDLGHRFAAACAVWEAITTEQMRTACAAAGVSPPPTEALFAHLTTEGRRGKSTTRIYRRVGPDALPDGSPHPAPWARLDRQFLIKLQGEDRSARMASPNEAKAVEEFEQWVGRMRGPDMPPRDLAVDALMSDAVRTARLALARHARRARIAHNLTATTRIRPGAIAEPLTVETRLTLLADTLADWYALTTDDRWNDPVARQLWNRDVSRMAGGFEVARPALSKDGGEQTKAQRKKEQQALRMRLEPLARAMADNPALFTQLHKEWSGRWADDDVLWHAKLRWLSRWFMPRSVKRRDTAHRHVGGLSLTRLATLTEFRRKVQVGFFTRMKPDGTRDEIGLRFGQSTLDAIENLKDNRVKQLASRIVEAALGAGIERHSASGRDVPRPDERIGDPRFSPCHAVVIEDLSHYRPEETRTRRENRATMDWKSAEARKRLADACQLHGLHLRDVNPQYTSRQDSRTASPGMRCADVPVEVFLNSPAWKKAVNTAGSKPQKDRGPREQFLIDLAAHYSQAGNVAARRQRPLRLPVKGGDLFVSAATGKAIQADLNAAANIGLRALLDPDFAGTWWYVPCDPATFTPKADKVKGSILDSFGALAGPPSTPAKPVKSGKQRKTKEVVNLWRDPSALPMNGESTGAVWQATPIYWRDVERRVIEQLRVINDLDPNLMLEAKAVF